MLSRDVIHAMISRGQMVKMVSHFTASEYGFIDFFPERNNPYAINFQLH